MTDVWVVWEGSSLPPRVFTNNRDAYRYRAERTALVRHQVYIKQTQIEGETNA